MTDEGRAEAQAPVGMVVWALVVLAASFMSWGSFTSAIDNPMQGFGAGLGVDELFGEMTLTVHLSGWNGTVSWLGMAVPNSVAVLCGLAAAALALAGHLTSWTPPRMAGVILAAYGAVHVGQIIMVLSQEGSVGFGSVLTLIAFVSMIVIAARSTLQPVANVL